MVASRLGATSVDDATRLLPEFFLVDIWNTAANKLRGRLTTFINEENWLMPMYVVPLIFS